MKENKKEYKTVIHHREELWHCEKPLIFPDHYYWCGGTGKV